MARGKIVTDREKRYFQSLMDEGKGLGEVADITGRSIATIIKYTVSVPATIRKAYAGSTTGQLPLTVSSNAASALSQVMGIEGISDKVKLLVVNSILTELRDNEASNTEIPF